MRTARVYRVYREEYRAGLTPSIKGVSIVIGSFFGQASC
jgi:hypothetical protein